jgi:hypothetical protein
MLNLITQASLNTTSVYRQSDNNRGSWGRSSRRLASNPHTNAKPVAIVACFVISTKRNSFYALDLERLKRVMHSPRIANLCKV